MKNYTQPPEPDVIFNSTMGFHMGFHRFSWGFLEYFLLKNKGFLASEWSCWYSTKYK